MEITEVKVFPVSEEKLKAFVSVVFDHCFMVNDIKIINGRQGLFISMPSRKKKNGEFKDVAHPLNNETRKRIEGEVLSEYDRVLEERGMNGDRPAASKARPVESRRRGSRRRRPSRRSENRRQQEPRAAKGRQGAGEGTAEARTSVDKAHDEAQPLSAQATPAPPTPTPTGPKRDSREPEPRQHETGQEREAAPGEGDREAAPPAGKTEEEEKGKEKDESREKTLEEVEEMHLRDSFWTVP